MFQRTVHAGVILMLVLGVTAVLLGAPQPIAAQATQETTTVVKSHPSQGDVVEIAGSSATLKTTNAGATMTLTTSQLPPGHVVTAWWVVLNRPDQCAAHPCAANDLLGNTAAVQGEVTYAGGQVVGDDGAASFSAQLAAGAVPNPWFGHGFTNPLGAEVHIVLNDHGPVIEELKDTMLSTYRGGCTDASLPPPFPATAKADGQPGPNTCRLFQVATFEQQAAAAKPATLPETGDSDDYTLHVWLLVLVGSGLIAVGGWMIRRKAH
jgi:hypothetical protein